MTMKDKCVLVVGASRGIGAETARVFAAEGADVVLAARGVDGCEAVAREISGRGGSALAVGCDVADYGSVEAAVARALDAFGRIDVLINNAGVIEPIASPWEADPDAWARAIDINLTGAFRVLRATLPTMIDAGGGTVINVSSGAAASPREGWSAYCAGKAGLAMLTRSLALETQGEGIRVFGFRPGVVDTDMQETIRASGINEISRIPRDQLLPASDPARVMLWLAGPEADDLAGQEVDIRMPGLRERAGLAPAHP